MDLPVGIEIDGYRILEVLGRGGMGVVYKAEDIALSKMVALKMIHPSLAKDESFLRRFRAEARALARIDSQYIVRVHALRPTDHGLFIVMEYVEGGTIADSISQGPMSASKALPVIKQMLQAFEHAHSVGVVHRDIKPSNIMLTPTGVIKVTDFGLAKLHQQNVEATVTQGIAGTLSYMSPEQVKGQRDLDHRSDLYSLGMTMYEMLAGEVPLDKSQGEFAVLKSIVEDVPPPPSKYVPTLPEGLTRIVMRALEKDPAQRYQSAREMLEDVEEFAAANPSKEKRKDPGIKTSIEEPASRRLVFFGTAAALILTAAAALLVFQPWASDNPAPLLSVTTVPAGATVYVGSSVIGETPIRDYAVTKGPVSIQLRKAGFLPVDTTLISEAGAPLSIRFDLDADASYVGKASGTITSTPSDAEVLIDEREVGRTPYTLDETAPAQLVIRLRKDGFEDWEREQEVLPGENYALAATLQPTRDSRTDGSTTTEAQRTGGTGSLIVRADPGGHLEVDGNEANVGVPLTLRAGRHAITCGEEPHHLETTLTISAAQTLDVTCFFRSTVNIVTAMADGSSTWASIWINGQNHGLTPAELTLDPGTYRISVQREGFRMIDDERTLVLTPALEPQTVPLAFRITTE